MAKKNDDKTDDSPTKNESQEGEISKLTPLKVTPKPDSPSPAEDLITKANAAALRQEEANKELGKLLDRQEQMQVETKLGGTAEAGQQPPPKEESDEDYAKKVMENDIEPKPE